MRLNLSVIIKKTSNPFLPKKRLPVYWYFRLFFFRKPVHCLHKKILMLACRLQKGMQSKPGVPFL